jgi:hypothetical protein
MGRLMPSWAWRGVPYHPGGAVGDGDGGLSPDPEVGVVDVRLELLQQRQRRHRRRHRARRLLGLLAHEPLVLGRLQQELEQLRERRRDRLSSCELGICVTVP